MMFSSFKTEYMDSEELRRLVNQIKTLTRGGYDAYDANAKTILRCLDKILLRAKEEKEWYLYFRALYYMLYELNRQGNSDKKILKYAEVFYYAHSFIRIWGVQIIKIKTCQNQEI